MNRQFASTIPVFCVTALLLSGCRETVPKENPEENSRLEEIKAEVSQFRGFKYRLFASISEWRVWYFQTDLGFKCVGSRSTDGNPPPAPEAVFERKSVGDVRLDMWITSFDDIPVVRVPNFGIDLTAATAGYFRSKGDAFMKPITFEAIKDLKGKIEIRPDEAIGDPQMHYKFDLTDLPGAVKALQQCEASGPKS